MKNVLRINHTTRQIIMDRAFAKASSIVGTDEYQMLQNCRKDYPNYQVITRHIKKPKKAKECYRGLTYLFMEEYIRDHNPSLLSSLWEMRIVSECHSTPYRYPVIKKWFLEQFPEIKQYGIQQNPSASQRLCPVAA